MTKTKKFAVDLDINVKSKSWENCGFNYSLYSKQVIKKTLTYLKLDKILTKFIVSLLLTHNKGIQVLNKEFMGKDKPTNVLSFPAMDFSIQEVKSLAKQEGIVFLGDVAISYQKLQSECKEQGKNFKSHFTHMLVHSVLHLLGYDHQDEQDAEMMENLEVGILKLLKIKNPYVI
jgi:probable rRNA maturation factor